jgi:glycosyltransferase involved in cell wall biosynthesis
LKIAFVVNAAWNLKNFRWGLMKALQHQGHTILAIAPPDDTVPFIESGGIAFHPIKMDGQTMNPVKDVLLFFRILRLYRTLRPDVVLHFTIKPDIYGAIAAGILRIPAINNITGLGNIFLKDGLINRIVRMLYKKALSSTRMTFFQNPDDRALFLERGLVRAEKSGLLPGSGIDTEKFRPLEKKDIRKAPIFLLIARMIREKGIQEYVDAALVVKNSYPKAEFRLVGGTGVKNPSAIPKRLIDMWHQQGRVSYLGCMDDIREVIREADCVVLPSYYREGVPRTLLEAASMAKPIITTDHPGCREAVEDGVTGFLCQVKSGEDLAAKMLRFLELTAEQRRKMGLRGREKMRRDFHESIIIEKYTAVINELRGEKTVRHPLA